MKHGTSISSELWLESLKEIILDVLRNNVEYCKVNTEAQKDPEEQSDESEEWCLFRVRTIKFSLNKLIMRFKI